MATQPLTPVLTRRWLSPHSWTRETYERLEGYQALHTVLVGGRGRRPGASRPAHPAGEGLRPARPGGAGFPTGMKWFLHPQGTTGPAAKPHYLVINADEGEPVPARTSR